MTDQTKNYAEVGGNELLTVELPDGIGVVQISTGNKHGPTGYPVITVRVVSDALDTPARDGRLYEPRFSLVQNQIVMVGRPAEKEKEKD